MVKMKLWAVCLLVSLLLLWPVAVMADNTAVKPLVVDMAGSFTADQARALSAEAVTLGSQYAMDVVIVTTNDTNGKSSRRYADDYFDNNGYGVGEDRSGILFLLDFDNTEAYISTSGSAVRYLTDARIERVLDDIFAGGLTEGDLYGAAQAFLVSTGNYLAAGIPAGQYEVAEPEANTLTAAEAAAGGVVALVLGPAYYFVTRQRYRSKPKPALFNFRQHSALNLGVIADDLVNTYVTSRALPKPSPSSGGGSGSRSTTHRSSSGRSHGGGGRKF